MFRNALIVGGLISAALAGACQASSEAPAAGPQPSPTPAAQAPTAPTASAPSATGVRTTMTGAYTAAQAERGQQVFTAVCSECHGTEDWTEAAFKGRWAGKPVYQLFYQIHNTMPYGAPSSLTRQQYTDIVAYILSLNKLPTGTAELGSDDDSLDSFDIDWGDGR